MTLKGRNLTIDGIMNDNIHTKRPASRKQATIYPCPISRMKTKPTERETVNIESDQVEIRKVNYAGEKNDQKCQKKLIFC